ncbi:MAG: DUF4861 family protein [Sedimentisphaerales bacterium]|nr:DUF4861 family protein [Sedimentisphaerales bacterium]
MRAKMFVFIFVIFIIGSLSATALSSPDTNQLKESDSNNLSAVIETEAVLGAMKKVADWQLANPSRHSTTDWTHGALFAGMTNLAKIDPQSKYMQAMKEFGQKNKWELGRRIYHADDHCVGKMYLDLYSYYRQPEMMEKVKERFDYILANKPGTQLDFTTPENQRRWSWCDALFMGPPVWAKLSMITGDKKYLDYMNEEWWATTDYLYDKEEHLYYRDSRFFDRREQNGKKIFWSRGNGWVFAGLARVLENLPDDHPDGPRYITLFKEMAAKLKTIQQPDGCWRASLLDAENYPVKETSGTGFYCYGMAWGINNGLLEKDEYLPAVKKAWAGLVSSVYPDGKLGWVQPIGEDPRKVEKHMTEIYAVGGFLLAGSELYKMALLDNKPSAQITVNNPVAAVRPDETISISADKIKEKMPGVNLEDIAVMSHQAGNFLTTQVIDNNGDGSIDELIFQTDFYINQTKRFWLIKKQAGFDMPSVKNKTYCMFVPQRKDDFAWENDRVAFRMYGPALEDETITCGIDAWCKNVTYPVMEEMYKAGTYHENHGRGGDFYKVGNTLGCGAAAPFADGKVKLSQHNFKDWKIIANGPIRSIFEMNYAPWKAGTYTISETKRISIDLGSNLNRIECRYTSDDTKNATIAAGIILRDSSQEKYKDSENNIVAYWLPADGDNGMVGCGVICGTDTKATVTEADNHLLMTTEHNIEKPFIYYSGSCWNENSGFETFEKWQQYLADFKRRVDNPAIVKFAD